MSALNTTGLASALGVTKGRVSQWVKAGKLDGCYSGDGTARRFDLAKVAERLGKRLDAGQLMGNGAGTRRALGALQVRASSVPDEDDDDGETAAAPAPPARDGAALPQRDPDRYELARIQKVEEEARKLRRQNAEAEGDYVLASEVARATERLIAQEIAEFEAVLRDGSRRVADKLGVDFKEVRQLMREEWRQHRASRVAVLDQAASDAGLTAEEEEEDI